MYELDSYLIDVVSSYHLLKDPTQWMEDGYFKSIL